MQLKNSRGDTIIEVLIALSIAGLAIGISFSIAHKALQKAVSARERDEAVGLLEGQVNALKLRQQNSTDAASFASNFAAVPNFCLDATVSDPGPGWAAITNTAATPLTQKPSGNYDPTNCVQDAQNKIFYLNISTVKDTLSTNQTDFRLDVRWPGLGGSPDND